MRDEVPVGEATRRLVELTRAESLRLLRSVSFGRIVFTRQALPAIRPINHIVDGETIIVRTHLGAAVLSNLGMVVAYEADDIDPRDHIGWSVIVTGLATLVTDPADIERYERLLTPWVTGQHNEIVRIQPEMMTGYQLTRETDGTAW